MEFKKYQHVERLSSSATDGILNGACFIFPKIDGMNCCVWLDNGEVCCGTRNNQITEIGNDRGFKNWVDNHSELKSYLLDNPTHRLYGEWLVAHTIKSYKESAWKNFYIFDIYDENLGNYIPYDVYVGELYLYGIDYFIPALCCIENPTTEQVNSLVNENHYLMNDDEIGEGVVIKNYDYRNKFGNVIWAKIIANEFKEKHPPVKVAREKKDNEVESLIVEKFLSEHFILKEYEKILERSDFPRDKIIPIFLLQVWKEFINEELFNAIKKFKNPMIDFRALNKLVIDKIKSVKKDLF